MHNYMQKMEWTSLHLFILVFLFISVNNPILADLDLSLYESVNILSAMETSSEVMYFLSQMEDIPDGTTFSVNGSYTDSSWNMTISGDTMGQTLSLTFSGALTGQTGSDITNTFSCSGSYGSTPMVSSGSLTMQYDSTENDYLLVFYDDAMTYGSNSNSKSVRAVELAGGAAVGGVVGGWLGALTGANIGWWLSDVVDEMSQTSTPPTSPPYPSTPSMPSEIPTDIDSNQEIVIVNGNNNKIYKNRGDVIIQNISYNPQTGDFSGTVIVPEPTTICILALGCLSLRKRTKIK